MGSDKMATIHIQMTLYISKCNLHFILPPGRNTVHSQHFSWRHFISDSLLKISLKYFQGCSNYEQKTAFGLDGDTLYISVNKWIMTIFHMKNKSLLMCAFPHLKNCIMHSELSYIKALNYKITFLLYFMKQNNLYFYQAKRNE